MTPSRITRSAFVNVESVFVDVDPTSVDDHRTSHPVEREVVELRPIGRDDGTVRACERTLGRVGVLDAG